MNIVRRSLVAIVVLVSGTGCRQDAPAPEEPPPPADTTTVAPVPAEPDPPPETAHANRLLQDVRAARHDGYDRVVFAFDGEEVPTYEIAYAEGTVQACGSGRPVELPGEAIVEVWFQSTQAHTEAGNTTVEETSQRLDLPVLLAAEQICDFEGHVTWALGLAQRQPYEVQRLSDPPRLVLDVQYEE